MYITLVRTFLLEAAILGVLLYNTYKTKESDDEESTPSFSCFETGMGQEMYRLSIMFLLMLVLLPFLFETGHMLLYSKYVRYPLLSKLIHVWIIFQGKN